MARSGARSSARWGWFAAWFVAGAACVLGVLGAFTIGIFVVPIAGLAVVLLATRPGATDGIAGLISGFGLPILYVAYLNRDGPGDICRVTSGGGQTCTQEWSPWPWLLIGIATVAVGVAIFVRSGRSAPRLNRR